MYQYLQRMVRPDSIIMKGRWSLDYDKEILDRKIYLTHMDHCGCCGNIQRINRVKRVTSTNSEAYDDEDLLKYYTTL